MIFKNANMSGELEKERNLLEEVRSILEDSKAEDERIINFIKEGYKTDTEVIPPFILSATEPRRTFSEKDIREACIKYRLRFLNTKYYKGEIPYEAFQKIKSTEKKYNVSLTDFSIIAPAEKFLLKDSKKDPLLFAAIGNGKYYLVHQWGGNLKWYRKILNYPFRNIATLALSSVIFSFFVALFLPGDFFSPEVQSYFPMLLMYKILSFSIFSAFIFLLSIIYGIIAAKDFSENIWDSEYFN